MKIRDAKEYLKNMFVHEYLYSQDDIEEDKIINLYERKNLKLDLVLRKNSMLFIGVKILNSDSKRQINSLLKDLAKHKHRGFLSETEYLRYFVFFTLKEKKVYFYEWNSRNKSYIPLLEIFSSDLYAKNIGNILKFSQLIPLNDAYIFFEKLYYYLYANSSINRAELLVEELIKLLLCKLLDEEINKDNLKFRLMKDAENQLSGVYNLYKQLSKEYPDIFEDSFKLDEKSLTFVVKALQNYSLLKSNRDVIAEAFQAIVGPTLRGDKGQFFTPRPVIDLAIDSLEEFIDKDSVMIDPACGTGSFIKSFVLKLKSKGVDIDGMKIYGLDIDTLAVKLSKMVLTILGVKPINIYQVDSLDRPENWIFGDIRGKFSLLLTNPPFGSKIPIKDKNKLFQYTLARKWNKKKNNFEDEIIEKQTPQVLFIERSLEFLKEEGIAVLVLPESLFASPQYKYVPKYLLDNYRILAVVSLPEETFLPSTHTKTVMIFVKKKKTEGSYPIFFGIADYIGHNRQGKSIDKNDIPFLSQKLREFFKTGTIDEESTKAFLVDSKEIEDYILIPEFYRRKREREIYIYSKSNDCIFFSFGELIENGYIQKRKGNEVGSENYGRGSIPFVRTSDLSDWFISFFPTKRVDIDVYLRYKEKQDVKEGDILFVADGTYLIGKTAFITKFDEEIVFQSHFYKFRVIQNDLFNKYVFFFVLNSKFVQDQIRDYIVTQATISSISPNLEKIIIPIPKSTFTKQDISRKMKELIVLHEKQKAIMNLMTNDAVKM